MNQVLKATREAAEAILQAGNSVEIEGDDQK